MYSSGVQQRALTRHHRAARRRGTQGIAEPLERGECRLVGLPGDRRPAVPAVPRRTRWPGLSGRTGRRCSDRREPAGPAPGQRQHPRRAIDRVLFSACAKRLRPLLCSTTTPGRRGASPGRPARPPALSVLLAFT